MLYFICKFLPVVGITFIGVWVDNAAYTYACGTWLWCTRYPNRRKKKLQSSCIVVYLISWNCSEHRTKFKSLLICDINCSERSHRPHVTLLKLISDHVRQNKVQSGYHTTNSGQVTCITNYIKNSTSGVLAAASRVPVWGRMTLPARHCLREI
jgi:hypothetical protein